MKGYYLVTGGCGFIGSNLVREMVSRGEKVIVIDNLSTGKLENISDIKSKIHLFILDLSETNKVKSIFRRFYVECVIHLAAITSVIYSILYPLKTHKVNSSLTLSLLDIARRYGTERFIYTSSCAVYGDIKKMMATEDMQPQPLSPYAVSKLVSEHYVQLFYRLYGLKTVIFRLFNVYGKYQYADSDYSAVIPTFISLLKEDESLPIFGDGQQERDFVYVADVVNAILLFIENGKNFGEVFNIASGEATTILKLAEILCDLMGREKKLVFLPTLKGEIYHSQGDISKIKESLGFKPAYSLTDGLRETIRWFM